MMCGLHGVNIPDVRSLASGVMSLLLQRVIPTTIKFD